MCMRVELEQLALEVLVRGELDGGVGHEDEGGHGAGPQPANAFSSPDFVKAVWKLWKSFLSF